MKGWIDRVFTLDVAFGLTSEGWRGDINGRIPLLHHQRVLIMTSTIFDEHAYDDGIRDAIAKVIDDWGSAIPASTTSNTSTSTPRPRHREGPSRGISNQAYELGKHFGMPRAPRTAHATPRS